MHNYQILPVTLIIICFDYQLLIQCLHFSEETSPAIKLDNIKYYAIKHMHHL